MENIEVKVLSVRVGKVSKSGAPAYYLTFLYNGDQLQNYCQNLTAEFLGEFDPVKDKVYQAPAGGFVNASLAVSPASTFGQYSKVLGLRIDKVELVD